MISLLLRTALAVIFPVLASCVPVPIGIGVQKKEVLAKNQPEKSTAPPLGTWHSKGGVQFLLIHGMNNHPFGTTGRSGNQNYLGQGSYSGLEYHLRGWDGFGDEEKAKIAGAARENQFAEFIDAYASKAGVEVPRDQQLVFRPIRDSAGRSVSGYLLVVKGTHRQSGNPVTFNIVCWSILSSVKKEAIYGSWSGSSSGQLSDYDLDRWRHGINRDIRRGVVTWGLNDASLYMGRSGKEFEWCVYRGLAHVLESMQPQERVAVVTASLGSTIAFNTIDKLVSREGIAGSKGALKGSDLEQLKDLFHEDNGEDLTHQTRITFYMFANQYGLIAGGDELEVLESVSKKTAERARRPVPVQLVAFTDPDDLLSMPFPKPRSPEHVAVQNIYVRNNRWVFGIPFAGRVANPLHAHGGYGTNPAVLKAMLEGSVRSYRFPGTDRDVPEESGFGR